MRYTLMMAVAALVVATPAIAEEWDFVLTNQSGKEIKLIELAPSVELDEVLAKTQAKLDTAGFA